MFADLLEASDRRVLADLGFTALGLERPDLAARIFKALDALSNEPGSREASQIGLGLTALAEGDAPAAVDILRGAGPSPGVTTYLGLALVRDGRVAEAREVLEDLVGSAGDSPHAELARQILESMASSKDTAGPG